MTAFDTARLAELEARLAAHVESGAVPGLVALVSRSAETHVVALGTLAADGGARVERDSLFRIASMTKPIAAAVALMLVEEGVLTLDAPVDAFLPELADRRVLLRLDGPLDETEPARRPITLRHLLTLTLGFGHLLTADAHRFPIVQALHERGFLTGPPRPDLLPPPDEWLRRLGELPLMHHPGERWMYDLGLDLLGVLLERASGRRLEALFAERLFGPLGMVDTRFHVPASQLGRFAAAYASDGTGGLAVYDGIADSAWREPPAFLSAAGGLVSTVDDYHRFYRLLLAGGRHEGKPLLRPANVEAMTRDQLTPDQRAGNRLFFGETNSWGFGLAVQIEAHPPGSVGRFGWDGGFGTSAYADPAEDLVGVLLTQRLMDAPEPPAVFRDFWAGAYAALAR
jgi:CubicO group peptidase (beta-lactamase class C family)